VKNLQDDQSWALQVARLCDNHTSLCPGPIRLWALLQLLRDPAELQAEDEPQSPPGAGIAAPENQTPVLLVAGECIYYNASIETVSLRYVINYGKLKNKTEMRPASGCFKCRDQRNQRKEKLFLLLRPHVAVHIYVCHMFVYLFVCSLGIARGQGKIAAEHFPEESQIEIRKILSVRVPRPGDLFRVWKSNEKQSTIVFKGHKNHQIMNITDL